MNSPDAVSNNNDEVVAAARALLLSDAGRWVFDTPEAHEVAAETKRLREALGICLTCTGTGEIVESMEVPIRDWKNIPCPDCGGKVEKP